MLLEQRDSSWWMRWSSAFGTAWHKVFSGCAGGIVLRKKAAAPHFQLGPGCPPQLGEELRNAVASGRLRLGRTDTVLYRRNNSAGGSDDAAAFIPVVAVYRKQLRSSLSVVVKRQQISHFVARVQKEAHTHLLLQHPHVLAAHACYRGRHHFYLVMEQASHDLWHEAQAHAGHRALPGGASMRGSQGSFPQPPEAGREPPPPPGPCSGGYSDEELRSIARQLLEALSYLHVEHGLAHRDIKPQNLLRVAPSDKRGSAAPAPAPAAGSACLLGRVVLADMGWAERAQAAFVAAGTPQFMPPECFDPGSISFRGLAVLPRGYDQRQQDMWAVGVTLASLWLARLPAGRGRALPRTRVARLAHAMDVLELAGFGVRVADLAEPRRLSPGLHDLLQRLLRLEPTERLTVQQALVHDWVAGGGAAQEQQQQQVVAAAAAVAGREEAVAAAAAAEAAVAAAVPAPDAAARAGGGATAAAALPSGSGVASQVPPAVLSLVADPSAACCAALALPAAAAAAGACTCIAVVHGHGHGACPPASACERSSCTAERHHGAPGPGDPPAHGHPNTTSSTTSSSGSSGGMAPAVVQEAELSKDLLPAAAAAGVAAGSAAGAAVAGLMPPARASERLPVPVPVPARRVSSGHFSQLFVNSITAGS